MLFEYKGQYYNLDKDITGFNVDSDEDGTQLVITFFNKFNNSLFFYINIPSAILSNSDYRHYYKKLDRAYDYIRNPDIDKAYDYLKSILEYELFNHFTLPENINIESLYELDNLLRKHLKELLNSNLENFKYERDKTILECNKIMQLIHSDNENTEIMPLFRTINLKKND